MLMAVRPNREMTSAAQVKMRIHQIDKIVTYESSFPWWVPIASFLIVSLISLTSVWLISRKAVRENPVCNLKTE